VSGTFVKVSGVPLTVQRGTSRQCSVGSLVLVGGLIASLLATAFYSFRPSVLCRRLRPVAVLILPSSCGVCTHHFAFHHSQAALHAATRRISHLFVALWLCVRQFLSVVFAYFPVQKKSPVVRDPWLVLDTRLRSGRGQALRGNDSRWGKPPPYFCKKRAFLP